MLLMLLAAAAAPFAAYQWITEPERLRRSCEARLKRIVDGDVRIERARFGLLTGLELGGVGIAAGRAVGSASLPPDPLHPDLYCRSLTIRHDPLQLLRGRFVIEELSATDAICHVAREESAGAFNLSRLFRLTPRQRGAAPGRLPIVRVSDATFVLTRDEDSGSREVERVVLSAIAMPSQGDPSTYTLNWKTSGAEVAEGRSKLALDTLTFTDVEGGLPWMSLETAMLGADARVASAANWFNLLGLSGRVRAQDYAVSMGRGAEPPRVSIRLRDAALSVPLDEEEQSLPAYERFLRFEHVEGRIDVCGDSAEADFTARFHDADCHVTATFGGEIGARAHLGDVGFEVMLQCEGLELPTGDPAVSAVEARFVHRWRPLRSFYNDFAPRGRVSIEIAASKPAGPDASVRLDFGRIQVAGADAAYRLFPYRVYDLNGRVEIDPGGIHLRELHGVHGGSPITVQGWLREPRWQTAARLRFGGGAVPLDADLHEALSPRFRRVWDQFKLAGMADLEVTMTRDAPVNDRAASWQTTVEAQLSGGRATFVGFPYPVDQLTGRVRVTPSRIEVGGLSGRNGDAQVSVEGFAQLGETSPTDLDLQVRAEGVRFNEDLLAAMPTESRETLAAFSPRGAFDLDGRILLDPAGGQVTYDFAAAVRGAEVTHRDLPLRVEGISGGLRIQPDHVVIEALTGRRGPTRISVSGAFAARQGDAHSEAVIRCEDLTIDEELLAALPGDAAQLCRDLKLSGRITTTTHYRRGGAAVGAGGFPPTVIEALGVSLEPPAFPLRLDNVHGTLRLEPGRIDLENLRAEHGEGRIAVSGAVIHDAEAVAAEVTLTARGMAFDEPLRRAVPWRLRRIWNNLSPEGAFDMDLERLHYRRERGAESGRWEFSGALRLNGAAFDAGARIAELRGSLKGTGAIAGAPAGLDLAADLSVEHVTIQDKPVEALHGRVEASAAAGSMLFRDLQATVCGGRASGEVRLPQGGASSQELAVTLQDVDLNAFVNAGRAEPDRLADVTGRMDAHLFMGGAGPERRGGGRVLVRQGRLYRLPLVSAIRGQAQLPAADESAAQELTGEFFLNGSRVELRDLALQGPGLALIGGGELAVPDGGLDLTLVSVSPRNWVKVPVLTEFLEGASRELVEVSVRGSLSKPEIAAKPLRSVEAALDTLFKRRAARRP